MLNVFFEGTQLFANLVAVNRTPQFVLALAQDGKLSIEVVALCGGLREQHLGACPRMVEQLDPALGKVRGYRVLGSTQIAQLLLLRGVLVGFGDEWPQQRKLAFSLEHGGMSAGKILVIYAELGDLLACVGALQHMVAHKLVQAANLFDRNRLVKQVERLVRAQTDNFAELATVAHKLVVALDVRGLQALLEVGDFVEGAEVLLNRKLALGQRKELLDAIVLDPENLGQRERLAVGDVGEHRQQHREIVAGAEELRAGGIAFFGFDFAVSPEHIGALVTFAPPFAATGLVVAALAVGHQQGQQGVNQRGFTRAVRASQQGRVATGFDLPNHTVEGAPVQDFQTLEPKAGCRGFISKVKL